MPVVKTATKKIKISKPRFYKSNHGKKKVLKAVVKPKARKSNTLKPRKSSVEPRAVKEDFEPDEVLNESESFEPRKREALDRPQQDQADPAEFDGSAGLSDQMAILQEQLKYFRKQNLKLQKEVEEIKLSFQKESEKMSSSMKALKKDLGEEDEEDKMFSFSKQLGEALKAIESVSNGSVGEAEVFFADELTSNKDGSLPTEHDSGQKVAMEPKPAADEIAPAKQAQPKKIEPAPEEDEKSKKGKGLLVSGVVMLSALVIGGVISLRLSGDPKVSESLVEEVLESQGEVKGVETNPGLKTGKSKSGIVADKHADLPFDETVWESHESMELGFRVQDPVNVVERLHNTSGVTFLRKDSFIFRVRKIDQDIEIEEYLSQNKDEINYTQNPIEFKGKDAIHLQLQDEVEFPGDRYLVKNLGAIYDIWFATESDKFAEDDIRRAQHMLQSVQFI